MSTLSMAAFKTAARFSREWKRPCPKIRTRTPRPLRPTPRPHVLDIERSPRNERSLPATVRHVNPAGAVAKIELVLRDQETVVQANLSRERYLELQLRLGDAVFVVPRQLRIFTASLLNSEEQRCVNLCL